MEARHREELSSMQVKLTNKETDLYKMEQLLLRINHSIDQAKQEKEEMKVDLELAKIEKIRIEERANFMQQEYADLKQMVQTQQESFDKKMKDKQMELWKEQMAS